MKQLVIDTLFKDVHVAKPGKDARGIGNIDGLANATGSHLEPKRRTPKRQRVLSRST